MVLATAAAGLSEDGASGSAPRSPEALATPGPPATFEIPDSEPAPSGVTDSYPPNTTQIDPTFPTITADPDTSGTWDRNHIVRYEPEQNPALLPPGVGSLHDFMVNGSEDENSTPLGLAIRQDRRRLKSGDEVLGLLVVSVAKDGPAAKAGLKGYSHTARSAAEAAAMVAAFAVMPPLVVVVPMLESSRIGDKYDLIIGVDGCRVTDPLTFEDSLRDLRAGEIVYLTIVRNGERRQVPVLVTAVQ